MPLQKKIDLPERPDGAGSSGLSIALRDVTKRYGQMTVVDSLNVDIAPGEFFSLLGPSGSGKTTTLMMIAGFASVDEGRILVDGNDVSNAKPQDRGFGMVFQNYAIFPHLNVWENVAFPLHVRGLDRNEINTRVQWALDLVRLGPFYKRHAKQLSGGQQQRVALARAIVFHPKVVLMDEPMGALDKNLRYDMQAEIKDIQRTLGMTVVYVTHDQEEAMNMSDRIAIMNDGRIEQVAAPQHVYEKPSNSFVANFLGQANLLPGKLAEVGANGAAFRLEGGDVLRAPTDADHRPGLSGRLFVRPEKISILPDGTPAGAEMNRIGATIRRISFLGNIVRYTAATADGTVLTVDAKNIDLASDIAIGSHVALAWRVQDNLILDIGR